MLQISRSLIYRTWRSGRQRMIGKPSAPIDTQNPERDMALRIWVPQSVCAHEYLHMYITWWCVCPCPCPLYPASATMDSTTARKYLKRNLFWMCTNFSLPLLFPNNIFHLYNSHTALVIISKLERPWKRMYLGFMQILCHLNNLYISFLRQEIAVWVGVKCLGSSLCFWNGGIPATHHSPCS